MVAVNYLWNPINDNIVREFDDSGTTIAEYTTEPDLYGNVISQNRGGQTSHLHFDAQGNTTELTNDASIVTDTIRYSMFGEVTEHTGTTDVAFQFRGRYGYYTDNTTGQVCGRRQQLSVETGRWLSTAMFADLVSLDPYSDAIAYTAAQREEANEGANDPVEGLPKLPRPIRDRLDALMGRFKGIRGSMKRFFKPPKPRDAIDLIEGFVNKIKADLDAMDNRTAASYCCKRRRRMYGEPFSPGASSSIGRIMPL